MATYSTIIICTYNRAILLKRALQAVARQTLKSGQFEVIVVDDGSTDDTFSVCEGMRKQMPNLKYVSTGENIGIGRAANRGLGVARGDYLMFTDDDCVVHGDWAERMREALDSNHIVAGAIVSPVSNFAKLCHNIAQFGPFAPGRKAGPIDFIAGANMGFKRSVLEDLNGFQEIKRRSPDMELILRARSKGYQINFVPDVVVTHDPDRTTLSSIFNYASNQASSTIILRNQYQSLLRTPFMLRSPTLILIASPVLAFGITARYFLHSSSLLKFIWTLPVVYALKLAWCWGAAQGLRRWDQSAKEV
jgi:GT2 family glycosyltransferase